MAVLHEVRTAPMIVAVLTAIGVAAGFVLITAMPPLTDGTVYWSAHGNLYGGHEGQTNAYLYSPAFSQVLEPLRWLPVEAFVLLWRLAELACLALLAGPWTLPLLMIGLPVTGELMVGNIHLLMAAAIVAGFRWPATWAVVLLTKPSSAIGLLWFVGAGDWRALRSVGIVTAAIVAASMLLGAGLWLDWGRTMLGSMGAVPLPGSGYVDAPLAARLPVAAAIALIGGRLRWRWTAPLAACLSLPTLWLIGLSMLVALIPLARRIIRPGTVRRAGTDSSRHPSRGA